MTTDAEHVAMEKVQCALEPCGSSLSGTTQRTRPPTKITWKAVLPKPGTYEVRVSFGGGEGLSKAAPTRFIMQREKPVSSLISPPNRPLTTCGFRSVGLALAKRNRLPYVQRSPYRTREREGYLIADAIQFVHVDDLRKQRRSDRPTLKKLHCDFPGCDTLLLLRL